MPILEKKKHEVFAQTLAATDDQSAAYRAMLPNTKAKPNTIWNMASKLAKTPKVAARVEEIKAELRVKSQKKFDIDQNRILLEISRIAFSDPRKAFDENGNLLPVQEWPDEVAAVISSIKVNEIKFGSDNITSQIKEVKFWDKGKQLDLAARIFDMVADKLKVTGPDGGPIQLDMKSRAAKLAGIIALSTKK